MKRYMILAVLALFATGCASAELGEAPETSDTALAAGSAQTEIAIEPAIGLTDGSDIAEDMSVPPDIRIEVITDMVASVMPMTKGSYCWSADSGDGITGVGTCVDCISPYEMVENGHVTAWLNSTELIEPPRVLVTHGGSITSVDCWSENDVQAVEFTEHGEILLPDDAIGNAYCVTIEFPQGTCDYIFAVDEQPVDEGALTSPDEGQTTPPYDPSVPAITEDQLSAPPELEILATQGSASWTNITARCGYYWEVEQDGMVSATSADAPSPWELAFSDNVKLGVIDTRELTQPLQVLLPEGAEITSAQCHSENDVQPVQWTSDGTLQLPQDPIGCVYSINVTFPQGSCTYVFVTGREPEFPSYEDGIWHADGYINYSTSDAYGADGTIVIANAEHYKEVFGAESSVYNRRYFEQGALIVSAFYEGSGSVSHEYIGIDEHNNIIVERYVPEVGTCDMAYYQLVVEIPQAYAGVQYTLKFDQKLEGFAEQPISEKTDIALVWMYRNHAWGYQCRGTFYDKDGCGYKFDFSDQPYDLSEEDMICLMIAARESALFGGTFIEATFTKDDMEYMLDRLSEVDESKGFVERNTMYDYGQHTLYGVKYENGTARLVKLYSYGDNTQEPLDLNADKVMVRFFKKVKRPGR